MPLFISLRVLRIDDNNNNNLSWRSISSTFHNPFLFVFFKSLKSTLKKIRKQIKKTSWSYFMLIFYIILSFGNSLFYEEIKWMYLLIVNPVFSSVEIVGNSNHFEENLIISIMVSEETYREYLQNS